MGMIDGLIAATGLSLGGGRSQAKGFPKTLLASDFMDTATPTDITTVAGSWVELGAYTVPAQTRLRFGYGSAGQQLNQGFMYVSLIDDTAGDATQEDGLLRLVLSNANRTRKETVWEGRTEELDGDVADKMKRIPLPEQGKFANEDDLLILEFKGDVADIIQPDFCTVRIPATIYQ